MKKVSDKISLKIYKIIGYDYKPKEMFYWIEHDDKTTDLRYLPHTFLHKRTILCPAYGIEDILSQEFLSLLMEKLKFKKEDQDKINKIYIEKIALSYFKKRIHGIEMFLDKFLNTLNEKKT